MGGPGSGRKKGSGGGRKGKYDPHATMQKRMAKMEAHFRKMNKKNDIKALKSKPRKMTSSERTALAERLYERGH